MVMYICLMSFFPANADTCSDLAESGCRIDIEMHKSFVKQSNETITKIAIADPEIADVQLITPKQALIISRKNTGTTSLTVWHGEERAEVYNVRVYVPRDLIQDVRESLSLMVPEARVNIIPAKEGVILDGEVDSQEMLERVLNIVRAYVDVDENNNLISIVGSQLVQLEVRIAEISRSGMKQMGLGFLNNNDWSIGLFSSGSAEGSSTVHNYAIPATLTETIDAFGNYTRSISEGGVTRNTNSAINISSPFSSAFQIALHSVKDDSLAILSLLKGQGLSRVLASPTLVAMSGQEAEFMVGGEYPYPVRGGDSGDVTVDYKRFGIMLGFTPTVVGKDTISIQVRPEVSSLDYASGISSGGVTVPGIRTRRGSTTLQLKDGQTFAMAGLISEEVQWSLNKVPFLGDIPVLGALFTSKEYQRSETELVIIVTPRLVRAMNPQEVPPLPGEDQNDNISDSDFFLRNRVSNPDKNKINQEADSLPASKFSGKTGFSR
ncbi:MAG: type II and III secretion system protein family protein [Deltaproteobacteria bacterium]|nr:type II and III secretion system protein family protein [Deltaproteobacteria bacterium]